MNSWHAWSPNGRWLVFATKVRGPYTQLCLTHVNARGEDTPPVVLEQAMQPHRACNIPEFLNVPPATKLVLTERFLDHDNFRRQGQLLLLTGEAERSVAFFRKALAMDADDHDARLRLAVACSELGRRDQADRQFAELLDRLAASGADPAARFEAHGHAAAHFQATGRPARAADQYRQALRCKPDDVEIRLLLALTEASQGALGPAERRLREALRLDPANGLAEMWLGHVLEDRGRADDARRHFRAALHARPAERADWLRIARRILPKRDLGPDLRTFLRAYLERFGPCAEGRILLAKACLAAGDVEAAIGHLEAARRIDPSIAWIAPKIDELRRSGLGAGPPARPASAPRPR
jgi:tetratricopeptide (TPR) repeat protein